MDNYDPMRVLGEGSFGKVYLMRAKKERTLVCVKVIKLKNIPRKEREACKKEVDLLRRLNHPNICGYRDSFMSRNRDSLCIVMEFCDGGDLSDIIKKARNQLFTESRILHYFVQMSLGLHYMHSNRILHRDLKTQNIFLLGNGRLVLGDLGICKVLEGTSDFAKTCIGTPYYMSPEIFKNKPYSHKADIWALGCVLYEMVTLKHAFDGSSINQLASKIIKGRFPPISSRYSAHLKDLITAMLQTNPNKRPSIERILKLPFISRHVGDFIGDIVKRDNGGSGIGAGTKMIKVAALNLNDEGSQINEPKEVTSLRNQLKTLGLQNLVAKATGVAPSETPSTLAAAVAASNSNPTSRSSKSSAQQPPSQSPRRPEPSSRAAVNPALEQRKAHARAQARALNREEERKKAVEAALARLRAEREERMQKRNKLGVRGREPVKSQLPSAARGAKHNNNNPKGMQRKRSNASNPALNKEPTAVAGMRRNPSAAAAPGLRRQPSKYVAPQQQQQVAELEDWEQRRKRQEMKRRKSREEEESGARAAAVAMQKKKQAAKPVVNIKSNLPLSKFAPGPIPQMKRPSNPSRNVRAAAQPQPQPAVANKDDDRKRQMEEFRKLKADKEILDKRIAAKLAQSKAREEEEKKEKVIAAAVEEKKKLAKAKLEKEKIAGDEAKPMLFVPAPVKIKKLPASVSASHINNVQPMLSDRGGRRSESVSALNGPPIPSKKVKPADLLADKIVGAAARGAKGVSIVEKKEVKKDVPSASASTNGDESSDFSESDGEIDLEGEGEGSDDEFVGAENSADDNETEMVLIDREAELEAELMKATMRCEDLKETLRQCKPETDEDDEDVEEEEDEADLLMKADGIAEEEDENDDSTVDESENDEGDEDQEKPTALRLRLPAKRNSEKENVMVHPAPQPQPTADVTPHTPVKTPPRSNRTGKSSKSNPSAKILADLTLSKAPTPENGRGSVSARVRSLQQRCVKVLGETMYDDAYNFLKTAQEEDEADNLVQARLESILGRDRVKTFGALIDQIVFMESQI
ncbi:hypothetical protein TL16_g03348 [Triparma laevis f. inornata]|uniref:non-specific serine/threonine protein kinase n=1 Tax=Triparma laevis f. inornata TaxID=1714386 RepID=A0A9W7DZ29_9STRA|nr:hypothetical protein TL16_g03348 [Triparma laevis f. inornata]